MTVDQESEAPLTESGTVSLGDKRSGTSSQIRHEGAALCDNPGRKNLPVDQMTFTQHQVELFERRFKEGFNLFIDTDYVHWLELHHPERLPADRYSLTSAID